MVKELNAHCCSAHGDKPFKCSTCNKAYASTSSRDRHAKTHEGLKFLCGECGYVAQHKHQMRDHMKQHRPKGNNEGMWTCPTQGCGATYNAKRAMKQHMQVHTPEVFTCRYCPKVFDTQGYRYQHERHHLGGFPSFCGTKHKTMTARNKLNKMCIDCIQIKNLKKPIT